MGTGEMDSKLAMTTCCPHAALQNGYPGLCSKLQVSAQGWLLDQLGIISAHLSC